MKGITINTENTGGRELSAALEAVTRNLTASEHKQESKLQSMRNMARRSRVTEITFAAACHEAAHAVMCLAEGRKFNRVCIEWLPGDLNTPEGVWWGKIELALEPESLSDVSREIAIFPAGIVFEKILRPNLSYDRISSTCGGLSDFWNALNSCAALVGCDKNDRRAAYVYKRSLRPTREFILERWDDIVRIGEELAVRGKLTQSEVEALLMLTATAA